MRIASEPAEGASVEAQLPLSIRIRALTSKAHRELEVETGWPETLGGAGDMTTMLRMFRALHASLDAAHAAFASCFHLHGFSLDPANATVAIDDDLLALGSGGRPDREGFTTCADFDAALGLRYVASGSGLGNILILRWIATHPDPAVAGATRFLTLSAGRAVPEFRTFRTALDLYGSREPTRAAAVIAGAEAAFRGCTTWLGAEAAARD